MNREKLDIDGFNVRFGDADFWFYWIRFSGVKKLLHQGEKEVAPGFCHSHTAFEIHIITEESASFQMRKNALYRAFRKIEHCTPAQYRVRKEEKCARAVSLQVKCL